MDFREFKPDMYSREFKPYMDFMEFKPKNEPSLWLSIMLCLMMGGALFCDFYPHYANGVLRTLGYLAVGTALGKLENIKEYIACIHTLLKKYPSIHEKLKKKRA